MKPIDCLTNQWSRPLTRRLIEALVFITGAHLLNLVKKSLVLSCGLFLFGCATTEQVIERKNYHSWENDIGYSQAVKANNTL